MLRALPHATPASLVLRDTALHVEALRVVDGVGRGLSLEEGARLSDASAGLLITGHEDEAVGADVDSVGSLPGDASDGVDAVRASGGWIVRDDSWAALDVP